MNLVRIRKSRRLTPGEMASACRVSLATLRDFERLEIGGSIDELRRLCTEYRVPLVTLLVAGGMLRASDFAGSAANDAAGRKKTPAPAQPYRDASSTP